MALSIHFAWRGALLKCWFYLPPPLLLWKLKKWLTKPHTGAQACFQNTPPVLKRNNEMNTGLQDWLQRLNTIHHKNWPGKVHPMEPAVLLCFVPVGLQILNIDPFRTFGYILHLEKDTQVVFLLSQRGEGHREPASCVATTGRVCAAWRKYDINTMYVNTLSKFWMTFSFIIIALVKQPCTVCP